MVYGIKGVCVCACRGMRVCWQDLYGNKDVHVYEGGQEVYGIEDARARVCVSLSVEVCGGVWD